MPDVYEHHHVVLPAEIDQLGHANNICFLEWMMSAAVAHSEAQGWPFERYQKLGAGWVVRSHQIEYSRPVFEDEEVVVRTWVAATKRVTSLRKYRIVRKRDDALLAEAQTDWAFVELGSGRITRIPPEVAEAFTIVSTVPEAH